jgi:HSP20 family protein
MNVISKSIFFKRRFTMSNLTLWEPEREMMTLREAMDRLFDDAFTRPISMRAGPLLPTIDLYQTVDDVVVKAALPGLKADDVRISVTADVLTLSGEFKAETEQKETTYHLREHRYGSFERSIMLPADIQSDKAKADFEDGILTITLPKTETVKPKTINIKPK